MKPQFLLLLLCYAITAIQAQVKTPPTTEELQVLLATKAQALDTVNAQLMALTAQSESLKMEMIALKDQITPYPRWRGGLSTTMGLNLANYDNWLPRKPSSLSSATIAAAANIFMRLDQRRYFWKNDLAANLGWLKFDDKDIPDDNDSFRPTSDVLNIRSLFGWKITKKLAFSTMMEYRTSLLNGRFNNPSYLDLGSLGLAWTPTPNFSATLHSLNYNFVFSRDEFNFEGSLGAKLVVDYEQALAKGLAWKSNFSAFASYKKLSELSNWAWSNNFSTAVKGFGVGLDLALRSNKQESRAAELDENPLQLFWVLGVSYNLSKGF
ncbi:MAG: DUF3078 domain-containing protein [Lewinellaceae bacterium]|nr:DUF3078 domain-containing protein [Lewinellaceae bacterium]